MFKKAFFILIFLLALGGGANSAFCSTAEEIEGDTEIEVVESLEKWASTVPECLLDIGDIVKMTSTFGSGIAEIASGTKLFFAGKVVALSPDPFGVAAAIGLIKMAAGLVTVGTGIGQIVYSVLNAGTFGACTLSFVRDPVEYYPEFFSDPTHPDSRYAGKMKALKSPKDSMIQIFGPTTVHRDGLPASGANNLTICSRAMYAPVGIFAFVGCEGKTHPGFFPGGLASLLTGGSKGYHKVFEDKPQFDGPNAMLCPEEFRAVGRKPEPGEKGERKLMCRNWGMKKCGSATSQSTENSAHNSCFGISVTGGPAKDVGGSASLEQMKLTFNKPSCKTAKAKQVVDLNGFKYRVYNRGNKICARLVGPSAGGSMASVFSKGYEIGCHMNLGGNAFPVCANSRAIYEDYKADPVTGEIIDYGQQGMVIRYDNSRCYIGGCGLSKICTTSKKFFKSGFPVTAYVIGCISESVSSAVLGCTEINKDQGGVQQTSDTGGLLEKMQSMMRLLILLLLALSLMLFGFNMMFQDTMPKPPEMFMHLFKLIFVLYFTTNSGINNAMKLYTNILREFSGSLQEVMMSVSTHQGFCDFKDMDYTDTWFDISTGKTFTRNYAYLKVWDMVDCRMRYYFSMGAPSNPSSGSAEASASEVATTKWKGYKSMMHMVSICSMGKKPHLILLAVLTFVFLILILIQLCEIIIVSLIVFFVLILVSPIFVPLLLFKATASIFMAWLDQLITFAIYPVIVFAFLSFMMMSIDVVMFGKTTFQVRDLRINGMNITSYETAPGSGQNLEGLNLVTDPTDPKIGEVPAGCDGNSLQCLLSTVSSESEDSTGFMQLGDEKGCTLTGKCAGFSIKGRDSQLVEKKLQDAFIAAVVTLFVFYMLTKQIYDLCNAIAGGGLTVSSINSMTASRGVTPHQRLESMLSVAGRITNKGVDAAKKGVKKRQAPKVDINVKPEDEKTK